MIAVTGASGHFGRLAVAVLLDRGVPPAEVVAAVHRPDRAADLTARGVQVRRADYDEPDSLAAAFTGVERLLLVSASGCWWVPGFRSRPPASTRTTTWGSPEGICSSTATI